MMIGTSRHDGICTGSAGPWYHRSDSTNSATGWRASEDPLQHLEHARRMAYIASTAAYASSTTPCARVNSLELTSGIVQFYFLSQKSRGYCPVGQQRWSISASKVNTDSNGYSLRISPSSVTASCMLCKLPPALQRNEDKVP